MSREETKDAARAGAKAAAEVVGPPTRVILRVILVILLVALVLWMIAKLSGVILLLILSIFFAYLVYPLVEFLNRRVRIGKRVIEIPRIIAIALAYVIILLAIVGGLYIVVPQVGNQFPEFSDQSRIYWRLLGAKAQSLSEYFRLHRMPGPFVDALNEAGHSVVGKVSDTASIVIAAILGWLIYLPWLILIPILSFFLIKDVETFRRSALQMLPRGRWRWRGDEFFQDINSTLAAYMRAQLTACLFIAVVCTIGFTILGIPGPLVMGVLAGVFEFIPLIGPLLIAVMSALLAALHGGIWSSLGTLVFLGILRVIQDYFVYPRLIGQGIHLHPLAVIIAILSGAELGGVTGVFLAIPVVAILTVSYRHWLEHRGSEGIADLLEPDSAESPDIEAFIATEDSLPTHPSAETTPQDMARARPDLTTGELKLPIKD